MSNFAITINDLLTGACDIALAPYATSTAPAGIHSVFSPVVDPPTMVSPWFLLGATDGGSSYNRDIETEEIKVDQRTAAVFEDITDISRQFSTNVAEINQTNLAIIEQGATASVSPGTNIPAQSVVKAGSFTDFTAYRVAFIAQRRLSQGVVTMPGGAGTRGRYVAAVLPKATLAADSSEMEFSAGGLATVSVTFTALPDDALTEGQDTIHWFFESAGTITS